MNIILEFRGGHMDGRVLSSQSANPHEASDALFFYQGTGQGQVGASFQCFSDAALEVIEAEGPERARELGFRMNHVYEVTGRSCDEKEVRVQFRHVPPKQRKLRASGSKPPRS